MPLVVGMQPVRHVAGQHGRVIWVKHAHCIEIKHRNRIVLRGLADGIRILRQRERGGRSGSVAERTVLIDAVQRCDYDDLCRRILLPHLFRTTAALFCRIIRMSTKAQDRLL